MGRVLGVWCPRRCQLLAGQLHQSEANYFRPITVPSPHCRTDHTLLWSTSPTLFEHYCGFFYNVHSLGVDKKADGDIGCSQSPFFLKIVKIEHFALRAAIVVSNVLRLAWE